jgi:hypothetical protein
MRTIMLVAAMVLASGAVFAEDLTSFQVAQATSTPSAAPATQAAPAPAPAPQAAAPDATTQPLVKSSKPMKKRQAKRRETDEEKARRIAAKYGVSW